MNRRSLLPWLGIAPLAALAATKTRAEATPAPLKMQPPSGPSWFCFSCRLSGPATSPEDARSKLLSHCFTSVHQEKLELMTANQVLKGQIKRRRRDVKVESGYAAWLGRFWV